MAQRHRRRANQRSQRRRDCSSLSGGRVCPAVGVMRRIQWPASRTRVSLDVRDDLGV